MSSASLAEFLAMDDAINFDPVSGINQWLPYADYTMQNNSKLSDFITKLSKTNLLDENVLRPSWDKYYLQIALLAAKRSNCFRRAVGAVMVKDSRIIATGYNGAPFGVPNCSQGGCPRCVGAKTVGKDLDKCVCIHAEENAVIEAGKVNAKGAVIYTTTFPCLFCTKALIQAGIARVVFFKDYDSKLSWDLFNKAGVKIEKVDAFVLDNYLKL